MSTAAPSGTKFYQILLAVIIGSFILALIATMMLAAQRGNQVVDGEYYSNGLRYGDTLDRAKNPGAEWSMSASHSSAGLKVEVHDAQGAPVSGGKLVFEPMPQGGSRTAAALSFTESAPGVYAMQGSATGIDLRGTLRFARGSAVTNQKMVLFH